jgi:hypothetical protein
VDATGLGESVVAADGRCALVSFITAPLATGRANTYVVFVTDTALAGAVESFEWTFAEGSDAPVVVTSHGGEASFTPTRECYLSVRVRLLDGGTAEQATLALTQQVRAPNAALEQLIVEAANQPGPGCGNPDVLRELVNDHNPYYLDVTLSTPEAGDGFKRFLYNQVYDGALKRDSSTRAALLGQVADSLNTGSPDFISATAPGLGVAGVRLSLAAMLLPPSGIPYTELETSTAANASGDEELRAKLAALGEEDRIDLFNRARFPKSNILLCGNLLEALRNKLFNGVSFDDLLTKMSGTMAEWIVLNYTRGPLRRP